MIHTPLIENALEKGGGSASNFLEKRKNRQRLKSGVMQNKKGATRREEMPPGGHNLKIKEED